MMTAVRSLFILALYSLHPYLHGQDVNAIFEEETRITWLGLDFSGAQFIGDIERFQDDDDAHDLIRDLNKLMVDEVDKYNINKAFRKTIVLNALEITDRRNRLIDASLVRSSSTNNQPWHLTERAIEEIVSSYDFDGKDGIGLMFNIESFNKDEREGSLWVTFIHMPTQKVLLTKRMSARPEGFGLRNYWAGCIHGILSQIRFGKFRAWKKEYSRNLGANTSISDR